jgi:hypothetical protein
MQTKTHLGESQTFQTEALRVVGMRHSNCVLYAEEAEYLPSLVNFSNKCCRQVIEQDGHQKVILIR